MALIMGTVTSKYNDFVTAFAARNNGFSSPAEKVPYN
jgi:hypothetical protein